jgi:hypothetical protein
MKAFQLLYQAGRCYRFSLIRAAQRDVRFGRRAARTSPIKEAARGRRKHVVEHLALSGSLSPAIALSSAQLFRNTGRHENFA